MKVITHITMPIGYLFISFISTANTQHIYCISTANTQHMQRPDVLVELCYIWRHVSAVKRYRLYLNNTIFVGLRMSV